MAVRPTKFQKNTNVQESVFQAAKRERRERQAEERQAAREERALRQASFCAREELLLGRPVVVPVTDEARVRAFRTAVEFGGWKFIEDRSVVRGIDCFIFAAVKNVVPTQQKQQAAVKDVRFVPMVPNGS